MATHDDSVGLEQFMRLTLRVANRLQDCAAELPATVQFQPARLSPNPRSVPEPMDINQTRAGLSPQERQRRLNSGLCLYCAEKGHLRESCPRRPARPL
ncbi:Retrotransposon-derived protein PEG10, partial [Clarias magur]